MPVATRRELLEAGVHFGHQTKRWNPKMRRYLYGQRSGIYIIDLERTLDGLQEAYDFLREIGSRNGHVLFVGTKKQAQEVVAEQASRVNMPFVNTRWLGGMLTNFQTIFGRLKRLKELRDMERSGAFDFLPKKEVLKLRHEKEKLERNLAGIQDMEKLPDAVFVIDTKKEHIAVTEARKLGIPVVAIVDTNCDPDEVDYVIPGNDDAIRACTIVARVAADAIQEGQYMAYQRMQHRGAEPEFEREPAVAAAATVEVGPEEADARRVMLSAEEAAWMGIGVEGGAAVPGPAPEPAGDGTAPSEVVAPAVAVPETAPSALERETASVTPEPVAVDVSSTWAAPEDGRPEEARTVPDVEGPADAPEAVEAQMDGVADLTTETDGESAADVAAPPRASSEEEDGAAAPDSPVAETTPASPAGE